MKTKGGANMETSILLADLRKRNGLTQNEMAEKLFVTRQAVSRWETGETIPNTETLKLISKQFGVSINTLLGAPRALICQCCGMPMTDDVLSLEPDGAFNEEYCKWCYADGEIVYKSLDELTDFLAAHLAKTHGMKEPDVRRMLEAQLPNLNHWKK
jgi:transcriptional regulator with XRE-family HTH domain